MLSKGDHGGGNCRGEKVCGSFGEQGSPKGASQNSLGEPKSSDKKGGKLGNDSEISEGVNKGRPAGPTHRARGLTFRKAQEHLWG